MKKPNYIPVADNPHLVRDATSGAILSTNVEGLEAYKKQREERLRIRKMVDEFDTLKADLNEIKELLRGLTKPQ